jgi:hypothetical protein
MKLAGKRWPHDCLIAQCLSGGSAKLNRGAAELSCSGQKLRHRFQRTKVSPMNSARRAFVEVKL